MGIRLSAFYGSYHRNTEWWSALSLSHYLLMKSFFLHIPCFLSCNWSCNLHDQGTIMTISKDRVKPSPLPDSWKLAEIFATGIVLGGYLAMMTVIFFYAAYKTNFFPVSPFSCTFSLDYTVFVTSIFSLFSLNNLAASIWSGNPRENCPRWFQKASFSNISSSEHYKSGSHIRYEIKKLVICRTPRVTACGCICCCTIG